MYKSFTHEDPMHDVVTLMSPERVVAEMNEMLHEGNARHGDEFRSTEQGKKCLKYFWLAVKRLQNDGKNYMDPRLLEASTGPVVVNNGLYRTKEGLLSGFKPFPRMDKLAEPDLDTGEARRVSQEVMNVKMHQQAIQRRMLRKKFKRCFTAISICKWLAKTYIRSDRVSKRTREQLYCAANNDLLSASRNSSTLPAFSIPNILAKTFLPPPRILSRFPNETMIGTDAATGNKINVLTTTNLGNCMGAGNNNNINNNLPRCAASVRAPSNMGAASVRAPSITRSLLRGVSPMRPNPPPPMRPNPPLNFNKCPFAFNNLKTTNFKFPRSLSPAPKIRNLVEINDNNKATTHYLPNGAAAGKFTPFPRNPSIERNLAPAASVPVIIPLPTGQVGQAPNVMISATPRGVSNLQNFVVPQPEPCRTLQRNLSFVHPEEFKKLELSTIKLLPAGQMAGPGPIISATPNISNFAKNFGVPQSARPAKLERNRSYEPPQPTRGLINIKSNNNGNARDMVLNFNGDDRVPKKNNFTTFSAHPTSQRNPSYEPPQPRELINIRSNNGTHMVFHDDVPVKKNISTFKTLAMSGLNTPSMPNLHTVFGNCSNLLPGNFKTNLTQLDPGPGLRAPAFKNLFGNSNQYLNFNGLEGDHDDYSLDRYREKLRKKSEAAINSDNIVPDIDDAGQGGDADSPPRVVAETLKKINLEEDEDEKCRFMSDELYGAFQAVEYELHKKTRGVGVDNVARAELKWSTIRKQALDDGFPLERLEQLERRVKEEFLDSLKNADQKFNEVCAKMKESQREIDQILAHLGHKVENFTVNEIVSRFKQKKSESSENNLNFLLHETDLEKVVTEVVRFQFDPNKFDETYVPPQFKNKSYAFALRTDSKRSICKFAPMSFVEIGHLSELVRDVETGYNALKNKYEQSESNFRGYDLGFWLIKVLESKRILKMHSTEQRVSVFGDILEDKKIYEGINAEGKKESVLKLFLFGGPGPKKSILKNPSPGKQQEILDTRVKITLKDIEDGLFSEKDYFYQMKIEAMEERLKKNAFIAFKENADSEYDASNLLQTGPGLLDLNAAKTGPGLLDLNAAKTDSNECQIDVEGCQIDVEGPEAEIDVDIVNIENESQPIQDDLLLAFDVPEKSLEELVGTENQVASGDLDDNCQKIDSTDKTALFDGVDESGQNQNLSEKKKDKPISWTKNDRSNLSPEKNRFCSSLPQSEEKEFVSNRFNAPEVGGFSGFSPEKPNTKCLGTNSFASEMALCRDEIEKVSPCKKLVPSKLVLDPVEEEVQEVSVPQVGSEGPDSGSNVNDEKVTPAAQQAGCPESAPRICRDSSKSKSDSKSSNPNAAISDLNQGPLNEVVKTPLVSDVPVDIVPVDVAVGQGDSDNFGAAGKVNKLNIDSLEHVVPQVFPNESSEQAQKLVEGVHENSLPSLSDNFSLNLACSGPVNIKGVEEILVNNNCDIINQIQVKLPESPNSTESKKAVQENIPSDSVNMPTLERCKSRSTLSLNEEKSKEIKIKSSMKLTTKQKKTAHDIANLIKKDWPTTVPIKRDLHQILFTRLDCKVSLEIKKIVAPYYKSTSKPISPVSESVVGGIWKEIYSILEVESESSAETNYLNETQGTKKTLKPQPGAGKTKFNNARNTVSTMMGSVKGSVRGFLSKPKDSEKKVAKKSSESLVSEPKTVNNCEVDSEESEKEQWSTEANIAKEEGEKTEKEGEKTEKVTEAGPANVVKRFPKGIQIGKAKDSSPNLKDSEKSSGSAFEAIPILDGEIVEFIKSSATDLDNERLSNCADFKADIERYASKLLDPRSEIVRLSMAAERLKMKQVDSTPEVAASLKSLLATLEEELNKLKEVQASKVKRASTQANSATIGFINDSEVEPLSNTAEESKKKPVSEEELNINEKNQSVTAPFPQPQQLPNHLLPDVVDTAIINDYSAFRSIHERDRIREALVRAANTRKVEDDFAVPSLFNESVRKIGSGGFGQVYKVKEKTNNGFVSVSEFKGFGQTYGSSLNLNQPDKKDLPLFKICDSRITDVDPKEYEPMETDVISTSSIFTVGIPNLNMASKTKSNNGVKENSPIFALKSQDLKKSMLHSSKASKAKAKASKLTREYPMPDEVRNMLDCQGLLDEGCTRAWYESVINEKELLKTNENADAVPKSAGDGLPQNNGPEDNIRFPSKTSSKSSTDSMTNNNLNKNPLNISVEAPSISLEQDQQQVSLPSPSDPLFHLKHLSADGCGHRNIVRLIGFYIEQSSTPLNTYNTGIFSARQGIGQFGASSSTSSDPKVHILTHFMPGGDLTAAMKNTQLFVPYKGHPELVYNSTEARQWKNPITGENPAFDKSTDGECPGLSPHLSCCTKRVFRDILRALSYLHDVCKLVHRDVKPSNILLNTLSNPDKIVAKLCDFGLTVKMEKCRGFTPQLMVNKKDLMRPSLLIPPPPNLGSNNLNSMNFPQASPLNPLMSILTNSQSQIITPMDTGLRNILTTSDALMPNTNYTDEVPGEFDDNVNPVTAAAPPQSLPKKRGYRLCKRDHKCYGTYPYMAPEIINLYEGNLPSYFGTAGCCGSEMDIWSAGATLFCILSNGRQKFFEDKQLERDFKRREEKEKRELDQQLRNKFRAIQVNANKNLPYSKPESLLPRNVFFDANCDTKKGIKKEEEGDKYQQIYKQKDTVTIPKIAAAGSAPAVSASLTNVLVLDHNLGTKDARRMFGDKQTGLYEKIYKGVSPEEGRYRLNNVTKNLISESGIKLFNRLMERDPLRRITAQQALEQGWFEEREPI